MFRLSLMAIRKFNQDNEKKVAEVKLQQALEEGERTAEQKGWMMAADVRKKYEV